MFDFEKNLIKDLIDSIRQTKQMHDPKSIRMECPYCHVVGHMKTGDFELLEKDREGYIHWQCLKCNKEFKYDPLKNKTFSESIPKSGQFPAIQLLENISDNLANDIGKWHKDKKITEIELTTLLYIATGPFVIARDLLILSPLSKVKIDINSDEGKANLLNAYYFLCVAIFYFFFFKKGNAKGVLTRKTDMSSDTLKQHLAQLLNLTMDEFNELYNSFRDFHKKYIDIRELFNYFVLMFGIIITGDKINIKKLFPIGLNIRDPIAIVTQGDFIRLAEKLEKKLKGKI